MRKITVLLGSLFLFTACSSTKVKNEWQIQSANTYESSKNYFLQDEMILANTDLKRAKKYAKQSADLTTLAKIELSQCALHVSVLQEDDCEAFTSLAPLINDPQLSNYLNFIHNNYSSKDIENLPKKYQQFAVYKLTGEYENAKVELFKQPDLLSKILMASLIKEHLTQQELNQLIDELSFNGYKKAVLAWLNYYKTRLKDPKQIESVGERLKILKN